MRGQSLSPRTPAAVRAVGRLRPRGWRDYLILAGFLLVALAMLSLPVFGYYQERIVPRQQPLARVGDTIITMEPFVRRLQLERALMLNREATPEELGAAPLQLVFDLVDAELIRQGAQRLGVSVSPEEIADQKVLLSRQGVSGEQWGDVAEARALREAFHHYLADRLPPRTEQVRLWGILLDTESQAKDVRQRLQGGEAFAALARELSIDATSRAKGGELGWIPRGYKDKAFEEVAFRLRPGETSEPVKTVEGYWVLRALEHAAERPIAEDIYEKMQDMALVRWLDEERERVEVQLFWDSDKYAWANAQMKR